LGFGFWVYGSAAVADLASWARKCHLASWDDSGPVRTATATLLAPSPRRVDHEEDVEEFRV